MLSLPPMEGSPMPSWLPGAQQRGGGLGPSGGDIVKPLEVLLEGEAGLQGVRAHGSQLGEAFHHGVGSASKGEYRATPGM